MNKVLTSYTLGISKDLTEFTAFTECGVLTEYTVFTDYKLLSEYPGIYECTGVLHIVSAVLYFLLDMQSSLDIHRLFNDSLH